MSGLYSNGRIQLSVKPQKSIRGQNTNWGIQFAGRIRTEKSNKQIVFKPRNFICGQITHPRIQ